MQFPNEIIFICGQRGSGKSYFTKKYVQSLPRCLIYDSLGEYNADIRLYDMVELTEYLLKDRDNPQLFTAAYDSAEKEDFPMFCRAVLARGNINLVVEEIDLFSSVFQTDTEFLKLLKYGRHFQIQIAGIARRPAEVSRNFTAQATRFVCFQNREPNDIKYFRSIFGDHAFKIQELPQYHYLDVDFSLSNPNFDIHEPISA